MRRDNLTKLVATLREQGVARYRRKTANEEIELELFSQPPRAAQAAEPPRPKKVEPAPPPPPKEFRTLLAPDEFAAARQRASRLFPEGD